MTDKPDSPEPQRPIVIPDGGLASALPEWMQVKPEWSERSPAKGLTVVRDRPAVEPETSPILLSEILTTDDMPDWLRAVGDRRSPDSAGDLDALHAELTPTPDAPDEASSLPGQDHPWWASDRVMAGLLIAVIVTILFVLITTIKLT